jgi:hypothetical protein
MKRMILITILFGMSFLAQAGGWGQQVGNLYFYSDDSGNSYMTQKVFFLDLVSGSNGYSGFGQQVGSLYFYND